jgi:Domain of unknown function (DUF6883)
VSAHRLGDAPALLGERCRARFDAQSSASLGIGGGPQKAIPVAGYGGRPMSDAPPTSTETPWPPRVGEALPRAAEAYAEPKKLAWILSEEGHGRELARVLHIGANDTLRIWNAIAQAVIDTPIVRVTNREPFGVACGVETVLTIGERTGKIRTSWHYAHVGDAPRLVTAYPRL